MRSESSRPEQRAQRRLNVANGRHRTKPSGAFRRNCFRKRNRTTTRLLSCSRAPRVTYRLIRVRRRVTPANRNGATPAFLPANYSGLFCDLVRFLRWSAKPPRPYLVMEFVHAQTLGAHLRDIGTVSIPETCLLGTLSLARTFSGALKMRHTIGTKEYRTHARTNTRRSSTTRCPCRRSSKGSA